MNDNIEKEIILRLARAKALLEAIQLESEEEEVD